MKSNPAKTCGIFDSDEEEGMLELEINYDDGTFVFTCGESELRDIRLEITRKLRKLKNQRIKVEPSPSL